MIVFEDSELHKNWDSYNKTRLKGDKKTANKLLLIFIQFILKKDSKIREDFVFDICKITLDSGVLDNNDTKVGNAQIRIQHPLFKKIILPILTQKYKEKKCFIYKVDRAT